MTPATITRKQLKLMINRDEWHEIGRIFGFTPTFMPSENGKRNVIDWRCVPQSMTAILQRKPEPGDPVDHERPPKSPVTRVRSPIEMRQLEHLGDAIVNLAARAIAKDVALKPVYFLCATHLATNQNLASAGFATGAQAEVEIGKRFVEKGLQAAFDYAVEIIKRSEHYESLYENK